MLDRKLRRARLKLCALSSMTLPRSMVLIYHRVIDLGSDPQSLSVTPENFDLHMDVISKKFHPISLQELVDNMRNKRIRSRSCVVTFDDGYEDNYRFARPILEKYGVPATIFVSSGYTGAHREFWWDELERQILRNDKLPANFGNIIDGDIRHWLISKNEPQEYATERFALGQGRPNEERTPHAIYTEMCAIFQTLSAEQIAKALDKLREVTGDGGTARADNLAMNLEQLRAVHKGGLIEIGAHTQSHVNLAAQSTQVQKAEIVGSKVDLENMLEGEIRSFAYPFGTTDHYSKRTVQCVKEAGFNNALVTSSANVTRISRFYEMPRRGIGNWNGDTFERALDCYYSGRRLR